METWRGVVCEAALRGMRSGLSEEGRVEPPGRVEGTVASRWVRISGVWLRMRV